MKTLHIKGFKKDIDLLSFFSDNYDQDLRFCFEEESTDTIENAFIRIYSSNTKCKLEEAITGFVKKLYGDIEATGKEYGYSEYTVEGFDVLTLKFGGHDLQNILDSYKDDDYIHILIDQVDKKLLIIKGKI